MQIGAFGSVPFMVSSKKTQTFNKMTWTSKANYHQHKVQSNDAVLEFVGFDKDKLTFEMRLDAALGVNPRKALNQLQWMFRSRYGSPLVIDNMLIGGYWHIESISRDIKTVLGDGFIACVIVKVTLVGD